MKRVDQLASNAVDPYFGILKLLFFGSLSHVKGRCLCWLPYRLGDDQQAPTKSRSVFFSIHSFLAVTLASPQPWFGVVKRTSRWCKSPRWQPWWRSSALRTADRKTYRKDSSSGSWCGWSVSQHALDERQGNTLDRSVSGLKLDSVNSWTYHFSSVFVGKKWESFVHRNQSHSFREIG